MYDGGPFAASNFHPSLPPQFIRYLIGRDFPGQRIGPEPTTDRFVAVMDGPEERVIPGREGEREGDGKEGERERFSFRAGRRGVKSCCVGLQP